MSTRKEYEHVSRIRDRMYGKLYHGIRARRISMKISDVIKELESVRKEHGEIEVTLQNNPQNPGDTIVAYHSFFIVPEEYEECGVVCNIRSWPY